MIAHQGDSIVEQNKVLPFSTSYNKDLSQQRSRLEYGSHSCGLPTLFSGKN